MSASLGRWKHVAELDGGAEASALEVEHRTTVALPQLNLLSDSCGQ